MATGRELVRMVTCQAFDECVGSKDYFVSANLYNEQGKLITLRTAKEKSFCHARILLKSCNTEVAEILGHMLRMIASTPGESMNQNVFEYYGFTEILIH